MRQSRKDILIEHVHFFTVAHDAKMGLVETRLAIIPGAGKLYKSALGRSSYRPFNTSTLIEPVQKKILHLL